MRNFPSQSLRCGDFQENKRFLKFFSQPSKFRSNIKWIISPSNGQYTCFIYIMKEEGFDEYKCDKNTTLGLNLLDFGKILKLAKANVVMTILTNEDNSFLTIKFDNESK